MSEYLLMDGTQIPVLSELAQVVGLNEAIVLQEVYYWCKVNKRENRPIHDGYYWVYNSYEEWTDRHFPWWHKDTVRGIFTRLEKNGLLISGNYNKSKMDRTKWYRFNFPALKAAVEAHPSVKDSLMDMGGITRPIPEIIPERKKNGFSMENSSTVHCADCIDFDIFLDWYYSEYMRVFGEEHPNIRTNQRERIMEVLEAFVNDPEFDIWSNEDLQSMATAFFYHADSHDWRINHFATPGVLKTQYYQANLHR